LTLDEISISPSTEFDRHTNTILGNVTVPNHEGVANHCLVFMLSGIAIRWKQVVAYYCTTNSTNGDDIVNFVIVKAAEIDLNVVSLTNDMGGGNRAMWRSLGVQCGRFTETLNKFSNPSSSSKSVYVLADVLHLLKNLRNRLINGQKYLCPRFNTLPIFFAPVSCFGGLFKASC